MKAYYPSILLAITTININAQTVVFSEDFQSVNTPIAITNVNPAYTFYGGDIPNGWEQSNVDGYSQHVTSSTTVDNFMGTYGFRILDNAAVGSKAAFTRSAPNNLNISTLTEDVLRTPLINLPISTGNTELSFKLAGFYIDSVHVYVSTSNSLSVFDVPVFSKKSGFSSSFTSYSVTISSFQNQGVYVYFQVFDKVYNTLSSNNAGSLFVDNVVITTDILSTGITENSVQNLNIYPNPFNETIYIESQQAPSNCSITITDIAGRIIKKIEENMFTNQINVSDIQQGIYFVTFINKSNYKKTYCVLKK